MTQQKLVSHQSVSELQFVIHYLVDEYIVHRVQGVASFSGLPHLYGSGGVAKKKQERPGIVSPPDSSGRGRVNYLVQKLWYSCKTLPSKVIPHTFPRTTRRVWGPD